MVKSRTLRTVLAIALLSSQLRSGEALWTRSSSNRNVARQTHSNQPHPDVLKYSTEAIDALLSLNERDVILPQLHRLESFKQKPDCFREVSTRFTMLCTDEMGEAERVDAAISFTLCEIATAKHHSVPMECLALRVSDDVTARDRSSPQSDCVEALSRSAQYWSSYSGYLREIPQLCFAVRRWNDIDRAKTLYQNATLEKIALIQMLHKRENAAVLREEEVHLKWDHNLEVMNAFLIELDKGKQDLFRDLDVDLRHMRQEAIIAQRAWHDASEKLRVVVSVMMEGVQDSINVALTSSSSALVDRVEHSFDDAVEQYSADIVTSIMAGIETRLAASLDKVLGDIEERADSALSILDSLHVRGNEVANGMDETQRVFDAVLVTASALQPLLMEIGDDLSNHKTAIVEARKSSVSLAKDLTMLSALTVSELQAINKTAHAMKLHMTQRSASVWPDALSWVFESVVRLNPGYVWHLATIPVLRVACTVVQGLWQISYYLLSLAASCVMIFGRRQTQASQTQYYTSQAVDVESRYWNAGHFDPLWNPAIRIQKTRALGHSPMNRIYMPGAPQPGPLAHRHVPRISPRLTSIGLLP